MTQIRTDENNHLQHQDRKQELIERIASLITKEFQDQGVEVLRQIPVCENQTANLTNTDLTDTNLAETDLSSTVSFNKPKTKS